MAHSYDTMMTPAIEDLLERTESKFVLVALVAKRSREITNYLGQLGGGIGAIVPPQVISTSAKALSIALEEVAAGKIVAIQVDEAADDDADGQVSDLASEESSLASAESPGPDHSSGTGA